MGYVARKRPGCLIHVESRIAVGGNLTHLEPMGAKTSIHAAVCQVLAKHPIFHEPELAITLDKNVLKRQFPHDFGRRVRGRNVRDEIKFRVSVACVACFLF